MKIECVIEKLKDHVLQAERVAGKNHSLPILNCIYLEAKKNNLLIRSTNLDLGIEITMPVKVVTEGSVVIPSNVLGVFLSNLKGEEHITLQTEKDTNTLNVNSSNYSTKIKTFETEEFPTIPQVALGKSFKITPFDLISGLKSVFYAASPNSIKAELGSVYVYPEENELVFVATDSFRLAEKRVGVKNLSDFSSLLIPSKNISEIIKVLEQAKGEVVIHVEKNQIAFEYDHVYLTSRVIDGIFPDYRQIIPKDKTTEVVLLKQDFIHALKIAHIFSNKLQQLRLSVLPSKKVFEVQTKNTDIGENTNQMDAMFSGEDVEMNFNQKYVVDCLQSISVDSISLNFNGPQKPLVIHGISDPSFLYLVMPMNK
jgi:DNA polymerase-3 subunit beta